MKRELGPVWRTVSTLIGLAIIGLAVNYIFNLGLFGRVMQENSYLYALLALACLQVYILNAPGVTFQAHVPWYDVALGLTGFTACLYFAWHGLQITAEGWMLSPPNDGVVWLSVALCLIVLEALRRVAGLAIFILCALFVVFPMVADRMPDFLYGNPFTFQEAMTMHVLDSQSLVGIPMRVTGTLLIGFIIFGVVLSRTGGGRFFLDAASALMGGYRGGAGKIAVVASALFGSMSGSSVSNVITTGSVTIPAMKSSGFRPHVAGAIEACASTGGMLMPPVMGAVAFLMAQFLNIPYFDVVVAALLPSALYYLGLLILLDVYAVRHGIAGVPADRIPDARTVLREGWPFIGSLAVLLYFLYLRLEAFAPFWAILFILAAVLALGRFPVKRLWGLATDIAGPVSELIVTLGAVGFIIGALSMTGVGTALSGELVGLAGDNAYLLLLMGAAASFILGMGLTASACYIFLAVVLAPGLVQQGFNEIAIHLFILYWAIISNITPPVALACFPAAKIAGASYFRVGFRAVGFGFACYVVPFAFVLNSALVLQTGGWLMLPYALFAIAGVVLAAFGIGQYLPFVGPLHKAVAAILTVGGIVILGAVDFTTKLWTLAGLALLLAAVRLTGIGQVTWDVPDTEKAEA
ncbi:MAG: TRAP transporter fused permease subunit [Hyphomicrobiales bacterium]|nr:TRAP transporter fused permease subunit [Hyphomicrobiales bacterium]